MGLVNEQSVRDNYLIESDFPDAPITGAIQMASTVVKRAVTTTVYADALLESPTDADRAADLAAAELRLAVYFLLGQSSLQFRRGGLVKKEVDGVAGNVTHEYLSPAEIDRLRGQVRSEAEALLMLYLDPDDGIYILSGEELGVGTIRPADFELPPVETRFPF